MIEQPLLVIIGYVWPEPGSSAAGRHMMEIIHVFQSANWKIIFATPAADSPYKADLESLHIEQHSIELNSDSFDRWISRLAPQAVVFDRFMMEEQFGWRVAQSCPQAMRILDTEDLHFLRQARQKTTTGEPDIKNETALREIASIYRCDLSLIISAHEMRLLQEQFQVPDTLLHYFPFLTESPARQLPGFSGRKDFLFVGTVRHEPNLDAIRYLKTRIWPAIRRELPDANLYVVGSYPTREVSQMHKPQDGFYVLGHVQNLEPLLESSRVFVAPLRFGAGLKGKLIEAMQWGIPSVTTPTGAEGIATEEDWPGTVADDEEILIKAAVELYTQETAWTKAQQAGYELVEQAFDRSQHTRKLALRVAQLMDGLEQQREGNFIGRMLMHHSMRSTEFMSRWIDCKNRLAPGEY